LSNAVRDDVGDAENGKRIAQELIVNGATDGMELVDAMKGLAWASPAAQFRSTRRLGK
jgi:hypothetical protein